MENLEESQKLEQKSDSLFKGNSSWMTYFKVIIWLKGSNVENKTKYT